MNFQKMRCGVFHRSGPLQQTMKNQKEIPVSEALKEQYIASLPMVELKIARAFDPVRAYKYISVPRNMDYDVFLRTIAHDF